MNDNKKNNSKNDSSSQDTLNEKSKNKKDLAKRDNLEDDVTILKDDLYTIIIKRLIRTKEFQSIVRKLISEMLHYWAGKNPIKLILSSPVAKIFEESFKTYEKESKIASIKDMADDPEVSGVELVKLLPEILNFSISVLNTAGKTINDMSIIQEEDIIGKILKDIDLEKFGNTISSWIKIINKIHEHNPTFYADNLESSIHHLIDQLDFGEIKDFFDGAANDYIAIIKRFNDVMWDYPAKVVILISYIPSLINICTAIISHTISRFNRVPPDLISDITLSVIREIDINKITEISNEAAEILKKLHIGSALIGEPGSPQFPIDINKIIDSFFKNIDIETHLKARKAVTSIKESISMSLLEVSAQNDQILISEFKNSFDNLNLSIRKINRIISLIDELPDEIIEELVNYGFSELEIPDFADTISQIFRSIIRIHELKPDMASQIAEQFFNSLDIDSIVQAVEILMPELSNIIKPFFRANLPDLIIEFCSWFENCDDGYDDKMNRAKKALISLLAS